MTPEQEAVDTLQQLRHAMDRARKLQRLMDSPEWVELIEEGYLLRDVIQANRQRITAKDPTPHELVLNGAAALALWIDTVLNDGVNASEAIPDLQEEVSQLTQPSED